MYVLIICIVHTFRVIQLENGLIALLIADCRNGYAEESMAEPEEEDSMEVGKKSTLYPLYINS
jgi:hypothetical protein